MKYDIREIVYPEGDRQEIPHMLTVNQIVDINGYPARLPFPSIKTIAFRVYKKTTREERNETVTSFHLEQLTLSELESLT
ncbi:MAG: hypothetical protein H7A26_04135 [Spirochaetales bacterium]|nr:hypothetical protein [Spirochaetales bacterium]